MILSVDFWPRRKAELFQFSESHIVISVTNPEQEPARISKAGHIHRLAFIDASDSEMNALIEEFSKDVAPHIIKSLYKGFFTHEDAKILHQLIIDKHGEPAPYSVVVHCDAGISRSSAIALFVESVTGCQFPNKNNTGYANSRVLKLLESVKAQTNFISISS